MDCPRQRSIGQQKLQRRPPQTKTIINADNIRTIYCSYCTVLSSSTDSSPKTDLFALADVEVGKREPRPPFSVLFPIILKSICYMAGNNNNNNNIIIIIIINNDDLLTDPLGGSSPLKCPRHPFLSNLRAQLRYKDVILKRLRHAMCNLSKKL